MKFRLSLIFLFLSLGVLTSACTGSSTLAVSWPGLTADGDTVYLADAHFVYALSAANGTETWKYPDKSNNALSFYAPPTVGGDGQLLAGGYDNILYSLKNGSANPNWTFEGARNRYIGSALATDQLILIPSADKNLYAVDFSGNKVWSFPTNEPMWGQPAADENNVYLTSLDHHLYAVNLQTGQQVWATDLGGAAVGSPLVVDNVVYAGSFAKDLKAVNAQTGEILWSFPTADWVWGGPVMEKGVLYFASIDGTLYAVDTQAHTEVWKFKADGGIFSTPLITNDKIYFGTENGNLYALSLNGESLWSDSVIGKIYSSPVTANNLILFALMDSDKLVIAYDENKVERWSYTPSK